MKIVKAPRGAAGAVLLFSALMAQTCHLSNAIRSLQFPEQDLIRLSSATSQDSPWSSVLSQLNIGSLSSILDRDRDRDRVGPGGVEIEAVR